MEEKTLPLGKLNMAFLADLLGRYAHRDPRVVVGPQVGEDTAVVDFGDRYLVAKTDPITFATDQIGWYAVQVNANDLATSGAVPRWLLATLLLPEGKTTERLVESILAQIHDACEELGIALVGGHTEVTSGLDRPIVVGHLLGEVDKDKLVKTSGAKVGDDLILTKGIAIEGTAIIAREMAADLGRRGYAASWIARAQRFLFEPGISVWREARLAIATVPVHSMHDPTEGGLATGVHEMAHAAGAGAWVDRRRVPVLPECAELCRTYGLDPLGLIASGGLLLAVAPEDSTRLLAAYRQAGIPAAVIGRLVPSEEGLWLRDGGKASPLPRFDQDEITKLF
ncbi:MAG: hydrogenase expression/formation protein [Chloroflexi bacterium]|nr:hydrogenase expression/formation protein [Chloroflexota bacterium]